MGDEFQYLPILNNCLAVSNDDEEETSTVKLNVYPNPTSDYLTLDIDVPFGIYSVTIYNSIGSLVHHEFSRTLQQGKHKITINLSHLIMC
jgi:hypothetical protein